MLLILQAVQLYSLGMGQQQGVATPVGRVGTSKVIAASVDVQTAAAMPLAAVWARLRGIDTMTSFKLYCCCTSQQQYTASVACGP
jgi:hypothetical protein